MNTQELVLNIAVNLGRLGRFAMEGKEKRLIQFLRETEEFVQLLDSSPKSQRFLATYQEFVRDFSRMKNSTPRDQDWAETMFTWANILTHRAKLAINPP